MDGSERALDLPLLRAKRTPAHEDGVSSIGGGIGGCTMPGDSSDEKLLEQILHRDEASMVELFRRYNKLAFSIGYRILHDEGEAEDFVQEVFLRLCSETNSFDAAKGSARTWMIQMIYRRALDRRAYLHRRNFYSGTEPEEWANAISGGRDPEADIIERLTARQLMAAFTSLNEKQRKTLEMFFFEGLTLAEIAERSNEDVKNVRHHYYRGLERLRQLARQMLHNESIDS